MQPEIHLGPVTLQTFGIAFAFAFIAAGALVGAGFASSASRSTGPTRWSSRRWSAGSSARASTSSSRTTTRSSTTCSATSSPARGWSGTAARSAARSASGSGPGGEGCSTLGLLDICAAPLALGYAIGRIGCQVSGDGDYGKAWNGPWAMAYPHGTKPIDTTGPPDARSTRRWRWAWSPICSGACATAIAAGVLFCIYLMLAGTERFLVEFLRRNDARLPRPHPSPARQPGDDRGGRHLAQREGEPRHPRTRAPLERPQDRTQVERRRPPSSGITAPVRYAARSEHRNATRSPYSSGCPSLAAGTPRGRGAPSPPTTPSWTPGGPLRSARWPPCSP